MAELFHHPRLDIDSFLDATANAADLEYGYLIRTVGQEGMIRDIAKKELSKKALSLLQYAGLEDFSDVYEPVYHEDESVIMTPTDIASREHFELLSDELGAINGYRLTYIDYTKIILDKTIHRMDEGSAIISIDASYSPSGIYVVKDEHSFGWRGAETMPLPVEQRDTVAMAHFIRNITDIE
jgi:hypothetical protein